MKLCICTSERGFVHTSIKFAFLDVFWGAYLLVRFTIHFFQADWKGYLEVVKNNPRSSGQTRLLTTYWMDRSSKAPNFQIQTPPTDRPSSPWRKAIEPGSEKVEGRCFGEGRWVTRMVILKRQSTVQNGLFPKVFFIIATRKTTCHLGQKHSPNSAFGCFGKQKCIPENPWFLIAN